jgi:hypothetical protein
MHDEEYEVAMEVRPMHMPDTEYRWKHTSTQELAHYEVINDAFLCGTPVTEDGRRVTDMRRIATACDPEVQEITAVILASVRAELRRRGR